jgi:hypothetical protein
MIFTAVGVKSTSLPRDKQRRTVALRTWGYGPRLKTLSLSTCATSGTPRCCPGANRGARAVAGLFSAARVADAAWLTWSTVVKVCPSAPPSSQRGMRSVACPAVGAGAEGCGRYRRPGAVGAGAVKPGRRKLRWLVRRRGHGLTRRWLNSRRLVRAPLGAERKRGVRCASKL